MVLKEVLMRPSEINLGNRPGALALLRKVRKEGVREYGQFALKGPHIRSALEFLRFHHMYQNLTLILFVDEL